MGQTGKLDYILDYSVQQIRIHGRSYYIDSTLNYTVDQTCRLQQRKRQWNRIVETVSALGYQIRLVDKASKLDQQFRIVDKNSRLEK